ncbi:MAG: DCC1-like thiol-disulfide oxidoreductase family protein [Methylococcaceae bacterium]|nr:DCC1-like thiol-disulfide oxidoreductase family protein [Methylococcaceae bacterium]
MVLAQNADTTDRLTKNSLDPLESDQESQLRDMGIDPQKALSELHVRDTKGRIISELDAYILLMNKVPLLKPVAWLISLPLIRPLLAKIYHWQVNHRLRKRGLL